MLAESSRLRWRSYRDDDRGRATGFRTTTAHRIETEWRYVLGMA